MQTLMALATAAFVAAAPAWAEPDALWDGLRLDELIELMAEEGRDYGRDLAEQAFAQGGGPTWQARVAGLYDPERMTAEIRPRFLGSFEGVETRDLEAFLASRLGQRIVRHELDARRAFLDPEVEAAAVERARALRSENPERHALIEDFIAVNDLLETNVASSLTFSYAFNRGLVDGDMEGMSERDALTDAWSQEDEVRKDTRDWLHAQLTLAFAPLSDAEIRRYIALSETEAGETLNAALFQAFEPTFTRIAHGLGEAVARSMRGRDI